MGNFISQEESEDVITSPQKQIMLANSACDSNPTIKEILCETREVKNWYSLGIQLEIKPEDLDQIGSNYRGDTERCKTEVVNFWLRNTQECTWDRLAQAVDGMGGHTNLVQTLRKHHQGIPNVLEAPVHNSCKARDTQGESFDGESVSQQGSYSCREQPKIPKNESSCREGSSGYGSASPSSADTESEDAYSSPSTPVGCGCGKCSLYTLCTKGCSKSSGGTPLPIWNGTESTFSANSWQYSLCESGLIEGTKDMSCKFASLVNRTVDSLQKVSLNRIVLWMKHLEAIKPVTKTLPLLGERIEEVGKAENVEQLFWILSDYWSWYNKYLLEKLITEFGDLGDQERLREYHKDFTAFLRKRLPSSQDHFGFGTGHSKCQKPLLIKVDEVWEAISLGQIRGLHHNIAEILGVPPHVLYLSSVSKGCICLNFMVPSFVPDHLFPLSASQEKALLAANAFRLECGDYIWQAPNCSETPDSEVNVPGEGLSSDKGYDGSSESEGQSDSDYLRPVICHRVEMEKYIELSPLRFDHTTFLCLHGIKPQKKRKAQGRRVNGSSKLHCATEGKLGHLRNHWLLSVISGLILAWLLVLIAGGNSELTRNGTILQTAADVTRCYQGRSADATTLSVALLIEKGPLTTTSTPHNDPDQYVVTTDFNNNTCPSTPSIIVLHPAPTWRKIAEVTDFKFPNWMHPLKVMFLRNPNWMRSLKLTFRPKPDWMRPLNLTDLKQCLQVVSQCSRGTIPVQSSPTWFRNRLPSQTFLILPGFRNMVIMFPPASPEKEGNYFCGGIATSRKIPFKVPPCTALLIKTFLWLETNSLVAYGTEINDFSRVYHLIQWLQYMDPQSISTLDIVGSPSDTRLQQYWQQIAPNICSIAYKAISEYTASEEKQFIWRRLSTRIHTQDDSSQRIFFYITDKGGSVHSSFCKQIAPTICSIAYTAVSEYTASEEKQTIWQCLATRTHTEGNSSRRTCEILFFHITDKGVTVFGNR